MTGKLAHQERVRTPVVSGLFYPEESGILRAQLRSWGLNEDTGRQAAAVIAPHGAWDLTGNIAGAAFAAAAGRKKGRAAVSRVIVMGPIHDRQYEGLYLSESAFFETPLGRLRVDQEFNEELESCSTLFEVNDIPHLREHSLEVLLPLVQFCFPGALIVPILMGGTRKALVDAMAKALSFTLENRMEETLIAATANLAQHADPLKALEHAERLVDLTREGDSGKYQDSLEGGKLSACGAAIIAGLIQSGLVKDKNLIAGPRTTGISERDEIVYYGALSFE
jgi:AmmeMemoRadiSam system protein B